ncbi:hypothetical protein [Methylocapsa palsarum]|uniref:NADH-Ubiquinone oxidoreductase (Complex I), chain 5 N-terminus n=1 Tax=Methylocapsa palsarum TaxID=1612308 RepID=A0A1I4B3S5_9HYPH|nr:hypothetical protein [Methylocapsa palsarum]SFK63508.1 NADH-Ubiquinone oxidoreductase (complex I), chain 5 N-terminus [Methylocapsa palsarum]
MPSYLFYLAPLAAPVPLLISAAIGFLDKGRRPKILPKLAEAAALLALVAALAAAAALIVHRPGVSPAIGLYGVGLSVRLDAVSVAMLLLVTFIGWVVVRYAGIYLDGEARQGPFTGWLCLTLASVLLLVAAGNLFQLVLQTGVAAAAKTDGRAGDGVLTVDEWEAGEKIVLPNHEVFQLAAGTLDPVAGIGDLIIVSNYAHINPRNLVITVSGSALLARRLNRPENHSEIVVLTGQAVDPSTLPQPVIVQPDASFRKIVGTLFAAHLLPAPPIDPDREFAALPDPNIIDQMLRGARLFKVKGSSAEPVALEGQYLITRGKSIKAEAIASLEGRLIVGIDEDGARYFKRLRCHGMIVVLESLNPDGSTAAEILSLDCSHALPKITEALEVIGVLFELPSAKEVSALS